MTPWQRRTRIGLAIFGVVFAGFVYVSIGERRTQKPPTPVDRHDPKSVAEVEQGVGVRIRGTHLDFTVKFARQLYFEDGSQKLSEVEITAEKPDGRSYVVTADEALAGKDQLEKQLTGHVKLAVSDGFELTTDRATHSQNDGIVRAPGAITFKKGHMTGSGVNATYDQNNDVLTIAERAEIHMTDEAGKPTTDFSAGSATLDRTQNVLTLDAHAHVLRNEQVIDADRVTTRLSDDEQIVTYIELRNNARVTGGGSIDSMSARDIDMDYTDDGKALERVVLNGGAGIAMKGSGGPGRQIVGESLDLRLASDGSITGVTGRDKVRLDLPASGDSPAGSIRAGALDGTGEAGRGLTQTEFRDSVEYREAGKRGAADRVVRSQSLTASLTGDSVTDASFKGRVTFEEEGLGARAADVRYRPRENTLALSGTDAGGGPHVSVDQISVDARTIDVGIEDRRITATDVKTTLNPRAPKQSGRDSSAGGVSIPGLLRQNEIAHVNADALDYRGKAGQAVYRGSAALWQGDTTIRGDTISLDSEKGNLVATGSARSRLELDTGSSDGRGHEIRYDDSKRVVTYSAAPLAPTSERDSTSAVARGSSPADVRRAVPVRDAQLGGTQGDLRAERIEIVLAAEGNKVERLEAYTSVTLKVDKRTAVGSRLTYFASDDRYLMSGSGSSPVTISDARASSSTGAISCRVTTGRTLTFFKTTDRIIVDGNEEKLTETQVQPCATPSSR